ncbi:hypothetical protein L218DRAFT_877017 [Marasmius fiardii PR-910]|nr:hypothetical protein L218DRAFT_877017 [Marasmius fiardii PR-910]
MGPTPVSPVPWPVYDGTVVFYFVIGLALQTFFFGIYASLTCFSIYLMIKKGLKSGVRKYLLVAAIFMFFVSTVYWFFKFIWLLRRIDDTIIRTVPHARIIHTPPIIHFDLNVSSVVLINYVLTDTVVFWRAWVLSNQDYRKLLYIPFLFLCCKQVIKLIFRLCTLCGNFCYSASVFATITIRITIQCIPHVDADTSDPRIKVLTHAIDVCQVSVGGCSLLLNISSTAIVALKGWRFRRWIKNDLEGLRGERTKGEKILLIESGLLYCACGIVALVFTMIKLPIGTLGSLLTPVNIQVTGIYPLVVLLLVNRGISLEKTMFGSGVSISVPQMSLGVVESQESNEIAQGSQSNLRRTSLALPGSHVHDKCAT